MKIMGIIYSYLVRMGMTLSQSKKRNPFNIRNTTTIIVLANNVFFTIIFLMNGAKNLKEYADSMYITISVSTATANFVYVNWKMAELFRFIENLEEVVSTSECQCHIKMKFIPFLSNFFTTFFYRAHEFNIENHLHAN